VGCEEHLTHRCLAARVDRFRAVLPKKLMIDPAKARHQRLMFGMCAIGVAKRGRGNV
jgi:hypothetical protein